MVCGVFSATFVQICAWRFLQGSVSLPQAACGPTTFAFVPRKEVVTRACALTLSLCVLVLLQLVLDAETVRMPSLPLSEEGVPGNPQGLFEVCVCPSGKLFLSKAGVTSTCSEDQDC